MIFIANNNEFHLKKLGKQVWRYWFWYEKKDRKHSLCIYEV